MNSDHKMLASWSQWLQHRLASLPLQDRLVLGLLTLLLGLVCLNYGIWVPSHEYRIQGKADWQRQQQLQSWLMGQGDKISQRQAAAPAQEPPAGGPRHSIITSANATAKKHGLNLKRLQPVGESHLRLWLENIAFDQALAWFDTLEREQLLISEAVLTRSREASGAVDIRLVLTLRQSPGKSEREPPAGNTAF